MPENNSNNERTRRNSNENSTTDTKNNVKRSILIKMIRHGESKNNQVYRNARYIYRGGTPDFDENGWIDYVDTHRQADPGLSDIGYQQADKLAKFLVPHLSNQVAHPVRIITSPMKRTLETILPTLEQFQDTSPASPSSKCKIIVNAFYHESEGCHNKEKAEEGMNPQQIKDLLSRSVSDPSRDIDCVGFPHKDHGWYFQQNGSETRAESETRAAKFYCWLCDYLDEQLLTSEDQEGIFDAGVTIPGEEDECEHDKMTPKQRRRRMDILVGHGDFMSLVLKRIVAGFGFGVENEGIPHRSAFVHYNTGITELEYFGQGRFLLMHSNSTPHIGPNDYSSLLTGGSLKDGWSYIIPHDKALTAKTEVSVLFSDEQLEDHVKEQAEALKALYLSSSKTDLLRTDSNLVVEEQHQEESHREGKEKTSAIPENKNDVMFVVQRGHQVVGVATYCETSGKLYDVAIRPSAGPRVAETIFDVAAKHAQHLGRSGSLIFEARSKETQDICTKMGFGQEQ